MTRTGKNGRSGGAIEERAAAMLAGHLRALRAHSDALFVRLLVVEWLGCAALACILSPRAWTDSSSTVPPHVFAAFGLGGLFIAVPVLLAKTRPGEPLTRHAVAVAQVLISGLLIHITGGRIETHFSIFGSLAFLAFYRDRRVLVTASCVVIVDHLVRGVWMPESLYGVVPGDPFRWLEHAFWILFADAFLFIAIGKGQDDMATIATREARLVAANGALEANLAALRATQEKLASMDRIAAIGRVVASVAHDINNPLAYVSANLAFLVEDLRKVVAEPSLDSRSASATDMRRSLEDAVEGTRRVQAIVSDLAHASRHERGSRERVDPEAVLKAALEVAEAEIQTHARLRTELGPLPDLLANESDLGRVFVNILVNAAQACSGAPEENEILVTTRTDGQGRAVIEISDTGSGMTEAVRARIFDPFYTTKSSERGTGLGLSICNDIVTDHDGQILVESVVGRGTTFRVAIPPGALTPASAFRLQAWKATSNAAPARMAVSLFPSSASGMNPRSVG